MAFNEEHGIVPQGLNKKIGDILQIGHKVGGKGKTARKTIPKIIIRLIFNQCQQRIGATDFAT